MFTPDSNSFDDDELVIRYVIAYMTCGVCHSQYRAQDVQIIDQGDGAWAMIVECPHCGTEGLVLAVANPLDEAEEIDSEPFVTNQWHAGLTPLTEADVVEWRAFLDAFSGDMNDLLQVVD